MSDAEAISYLNKTTVPVIGNDSLRTQLSELSRALHHPKWPRAGACSVPRHIDMSSGSFVAESSVRSPRK